MRVSQLKSKSGRDQPHRRECAGKGRSKYSMVFTSTVHCTVLIVEEEKAYVVCMCCLASHRSIVGHNFH